MITFCFQTFTWTNWQIYFYIVFPFSVFKVSQYICFLQVGAIKNFDLERMMGCWYVVQYYASTEELPEYACMRSHFSFSKEDQHVGVT